MTNGWTGGQYSVIRAVGGLFLLLHFAGALRGAESPVALAAAIAGLVAAPFFIAGLMDRIAAIVLACALLCAFVLDPTMRHAPSLLLCCPLVAHAVLPRAPYGSIAARGRVDPDGRWRYPPRLFAATWIAAAAAYAALACATLCDGSSIAWAPGLSFAKVAGWIVAVVEIVFAVLAAVGRARKWIWLAMLGANVLRAFTHESLDASLGVLVFHLFIADPGWLRGVKPAVTETVFFDGTCGLCHRGVRLMVAEDRAGTVFEYSPIGGGRFRAMIGDPTGLPDSVVIRTAEGATLDRSTGTIYAMRRLGGIWRVLAGGLSVIPRRARDAIYDFIARVRYRVWGRQKEACPLLPPELRSRFKP